MDEHWETWRRVLPELPRKPSEYVLRQCVISTEPGEDMIDAVVAHVGEDNVVWASDYPHPDATFPGAVTRSLAAMDALGPRAARRCWPRTRSGSTICPSACRSAGVAPGSRRCFTAGLVWPRRPRLESQHGDDRHRGEPARAPGRGARDPPHVLRYQLRVALWQREGRAAGPVR